MRWADLSAHGARMVVEHAQDGPRLVVESTNGGRLSPLMHALGFQAQGAARFVRNELSVSLAALRTVFPGAVERDMHEAQVVRDADQLRSLRGNLRRFFGPDADVENIRLATPDPRTALRAGAIAKVLNVEPVFIRYSGQDNRLAFAGVSGKERGDNRIYVSVDSEFPTMGVLAHEAVHQMRAQQPELYAELVEQLRPAINATAWARYYHDLKRRSLREDMQVMDDDLIREEAVADIVGDLLLDPHVWEAIDDRDLLARLLEWLQEFMANLVAMFRQAGPVVEGSLGGRELVQDLQAAQGAIVWAMQNWKLRTRESTLADDLQLAFRLASGPAPDPSAAERLQQSKVRNADGSLRTVYRGQYADSDSPAAIESKLPSIPFTISPDVASVYACHSGVYPQVPRVSACYLDIRNPVVLGELDPLVTLREFWEALQPSGKVTYEEAADAFGRTGFVRLINEESEDFGGDYMQFSPASDDVLTEDSYIDVYRVADNARCVELVKRAGYDGIVFHGPFTSEDLFDRDRETIAAAGYDFLDDSALEYRVFDASQVVSIFDASLDPVLSGVQFRRAYHGSPARFERPSLDFNKTGEGGNAFGYGMYFAEASQVASVYREKLAYQAQIVRFGDQMTTGGELAAVAERLLGAGAGDEANWVLHMQASGYRSDDLQRIVDGMDEPRRRTISAILERLERFHPQAARISGVLLAHSAGTAAFDAAGGVAGGTLASRELRFLLDQGQTLDQAREMVLAEQRERVRALGEYLKDDEDRLSRANVAGDVEAIDRASASLRDTRWFIREADAACRLLSDPGLLMADTRHLASEGFIYEADIDDEALLLEWEQVVSDEQLQAILAVLEPAPAARLADAWADQTEAYGRQGRDLYHTLQVVLGTPEAASHALGRAGYSGLRYLDGHSRVSASEPTYNFVVWDLGAVKSFAPVAFKRGGLSSPDEEVFHSALLRSLEGINGAPKRAGAEQWLQWLDGAQRRGLIKGTERAWTGVDAWLKGREGDVSRVELADFVRHSVPKLTTRVYGDMPTARAALEDAGYELRIHHEDIQILDAQGQEIHETQLPAELKEAMALARRSHERPTWYAGHQLPWSDGDPQDSYRELLIMMDAPSGSAARQAREEAQATHKAVEAAGERGAPVAEINALHATFAATSQIYSAYRETEGEQLFQSTHFSNKRGILVHARFSERKDEHGLRTLMIEEIQSDWAQAGRERGFAPPELAAQRLAMRLEVAGLRNELAVRSALPSQEQENRRLAVQKRLDVLDSTLKMPFEVVPDTPLKRSEDWSMLAYRRLVRWAAEAGFHQVAWTTGDTQIDRYSTKLRQQVNVVDWSNAGHLTNVGAFRDGKLVFHCKLDAEGTVVYCDERKAVGMSARKLFGREVFESILAQPNGRLEGKGLTVGGQGMRGFYDEILPAAVKRWAKPLGGDVSTTRIETPAAGGGSHRMSLLMPDELEALITYDCFRSQDHVDLDFYQAKKSLEEGIAVFVGHDVPMTELHCMRITDAMRDVVMDSMPMFKRARRVPLPSLEDEREEAMKVAVGF